MMEPTFYRHLAAQVQHRRKFDPVFDEFMRQEEENEDPKENGTYPDTLIQLEHTVYAFRAECERLFKAYQHILKRDKMQSPPLSSWWMGECWHGLLLNPAIYTSFCERVFGQVIQYDTDWEGDCIDGYNGKYIKFLDPGMYPPWWDNRSQIPYFCPDYSENAAGRERLYIGTCEWRVRGCCNKEYEKFLEVDDNVDVDVDACTSTNNNDDFVYDENAPDFGDYPIGFLFDQM